ncbi:DUF29 domain-containing protein [Leptolyngbya sp. 15MV]|nr:DUF29 domain-containing protein [Leptolyngbya sp. 15MV]
MPDDLYHRDFVAWSQAQADRLRRLAAGERVNDLDWANLIEEVEDLGRSQVQAVESLLVQALIHAMKIAAWPEHPARGHWRGELIAFLNNARRRYTPSMARVLHIEEIYADALEAARGTSLEQPPRPLRDTSTLTIGDLLSRTLSPEDLAARVRAD